MNVGNGLGERGGLWADCVSPKFICQSPNPHVTVCGGTVLKEVIKLNEVLKMEL